MTPTTVPATTTVPRCQRWAVASPLTILRLPRIHAKTSTAYISAGRAIMSLHTALRLRRAMVSVTPIVPQNIAAAHARTSEVTIKTVSVTTRIPPTTAGNIALTASATPIDPADILLLHAPILAD